MFADCTESTDSHSIAYFPNRVGRSYWLELFLAAGGKNASEISLLFLSTCSPLNLLILISSIATTMRSGKIQGGGWGFFAGFLGLLFLHARWQFPMNAAGVGAAFPGRCQGFVGLVWPLGGAVLMRMVTEMYSGIWVLLDSKVVFQARETNFVARGVNNSFS